MKARFMVPGSDEERDAIIQASAALGPLPPGPDHDPYSEEAKGKAAEKGGKGGKGGKWRGGKAASGKGKGW